MDEFKIIEEFPDYIIKPNGQVINIKTGKIKKTQIKGNDYPCVRFDKNGIKYNRKIHRLVIEAFKQKQPSKEHNVNHINGNRSDFSLNNLEWVTQKENIYHSRNITKNGSVISRQKIDIIYSKNKHLSTFDLIQLIKSNCK